MHNGHIASGLRGVAFYKESKDVIKKEYKIFKKEDMKKLGYLVLLLVVFTGCKNAAQHESQGEITAVDTHEAVWEGQLNVVKEKSADLFGTSGISLIEYQFVDDIDNQQKLVKYKNVLKEEQDVFSYYDQSLNRIKILNKKEIQDMNPAQFQISFDKLNEYIDKSVHDGMKVIRLTWDNNGTTINTLCIVSDMEGIVYDCLLTNIILLSNVKTVTEEEVK